MISIIGIVLVVLLARFGQTDTIIIPGPDENHPYKSAVTHFSLLNQAHTYSTNIGTRMIQVSLFMPVAKEMCTNECQNSYMPDMTAKICNEQFLGDRNRGVFEMMNYKVCCGASQSTNAANIPIVVLDPHTDTTRMLYATMARYFSANGVAVLTIDHPGDTSIVEFDTGPVAFNSGSTKLSNFSPLTQWNDTVTTAVSIRIHDIQFALQSLSDPTLLSTYFPSMNYTTALDPTSYSLIGHGLGGTVATSLSTSDPRVRFSINLSGSSPPLTHDTKAPIYFFGRSDFRRKDDINWGTAWSHLFGPATEFDLKDADIMDFTDLPVVIELAQKAHVNVGKVTGLGKVGVWGNHAVKCFVEGVINDRINNEFYDPYHVAMPTVKDCVEMFDQMVPYMAVSMENGKGQDVDVKLVGGTMPTQSKTSAAVSKHMSWGSLFGRGWRFGGSGRHGVDWSRFCNTARAPGVLVNIWPL